MLYSVKVNLNNTCVYACVCVRMYVCVGTGKPYMVFRVEYFSVYVTNYKSLESTIKSNSSNEGITIRKSKYELYNN